MSSRFKPTSGAGALDSGSFPPDPFRRGGGLHVLVVTDSTDAFPRRSFLLASLAKEWEGMGIRVSVVDPSDEPVAADVAILHVDLTVVPEVHCSLAARCPVVINGAAADISKRRVSRHLVTRDSSFEGPVIVKTDRNFGGMPERGRVRRGVGRKLTGAVAARLPWPLSGRLDPSAYPIFESKDRVPLPVWFNPRLVVEAFLPEREGEYYCLRNWIFLGDREISLRSLGRSPVLKAADVLEWEYDVAIPEELRRLREELGFDYGKFDFAMSGGRVVLYDANRTPTFSSRSSSGVDAEESPTSPGRDAAGLGSSAGRPGQTRERVRELARGLFSCVAP